MPTRFSVGTSLQRLRLGAAAPSGDVPVQPDPPDLHELLYGDGNGITWADGTIINWPGI